MRRRNELGDRFDALNHLLIFPRAILDLFLNSCFLFRDLRVFFFVKTFWYRVVDKFLYERVFFLLEDFQFLFQFFVEATGIFLHRGIFLFRCVDNEIENVFIESDLFEFAADTFDQIFLANISLRAFVRAKRLSASIIRVSLFDLRSDFQSALAADHQSSKRKLSLIFSFEIPIWEKVSSARHQKAVWKRSEHGHPCMFSPATETFRNRSG